MIMFWLPAYPRALRGFVTFETGGARFHAQLYWGRKPWQFASAVLTEEISHYGLTFINIGIKMSLSTFLIRLENTIMRG